MSSDGFGRSVAIRGTTALLGAPGHHVNPTGSSTAYIYEDGDTGWLLQSVLSATDAVYGDDFAASVALTDGVALVGAFQHKVKTNVRAGSAYVFAAEATNGDACVTDGDCLSGHCVDAVCCDTPCGGGSSTDCLSCLGAMTGGADGTCGTVTAAAGFACRPSVGPCDPAETCDGSSSACPADAHEDQGTTCPDDGNACTSDACDENGTCQHPSLADGTPCGDGEVCGSGSCASACFIDGALYPAGTVNAANPCLVCRPATSTTMWSNASEGTACDDGDACTQTDACQAGACTGGNPVTCTPMDDCHLAGVCDSATGSCSNPSKPDGEPCAGGTCQAGTCTPTDTTTSSGTGGGATTGSGTGGGATTSSGASSTSTTGAGGSGGASAGGGGTPAQSGGCGCAVPGGESDDDGAPATLAIALVAWGLDRRARKRRR
ncbi:MAG TPA: hypothetical protein VHB21_23315 [Minicystis sp.]|nr:hypothetical protein [Minicystis sp.]